MNVRDVLPSRPFARFAARAALIAALVAICSPVGVRADDANDIRSLIGVTWDKPEAKVDTRPVVVANDHAVAGWTQAERGGRALLRRVHGKWYVMLCGGDALKEAGRLHEAGVPMDTAKELAFMLDAAEAQISTERRKAFSTFNGIVEIEADHSHH